MKWQIPGKTFLVGEYSAIADNAAIVLTTSPCFEVSMQRTGTLPAIHPESPAGQWWQKQAAVDWSLHWHDPYKSCGGLGASSAQFLGAYLASCYLQKCIPQPETILEAYYQSAWLGEGLKPSGYDILAQLKNRCVYINRQHKISKTYDWVFEGISFLLLHSGNKLATHCHLQTLALPKINELAGTVEQAKLAFEKKNAVALIESVNTYQEQLVKLGLMASHSIDALQALKAQHSEILAAKGCGALGADVLLLIVPSAILKAKVRSLKQQGWLVLASSENLYTGKTLLKKEQKTLEFLI